MSRNSAQGEGDWYEGYTQSFPSLLNGGSMLLAGQTAQRTGQSVKKIRVFSGRTRPMVTNFMAFFISVRVCGCVCVRYILNVHRLSEIMFVHWVEDCGTSLYWVLLRNSEWSLDSL